MNRIRLAVFFGQYFQFTVEHPQPVPKFRPVAGVDDFLDRGVHITAFVAITLSQTNVGHIDGITRISHFVEKLEILAEVFVRNVGEYLIPELGTRVFFFHGIDKSSQFIAEPFRRFVGEN